MQVLVVSEDPEERARATSALLLQGDVDVLEAASAAEARRMLAGTIVDVLVVDGDLTPMGGFSLLYELRAGADLAGDETPPALILLGREEDRWLAGWAGANDTVRKPVDPFRLAALVHDLAGTEPAERLEVEVSDEQAAEAAAAEGGTAGLSPATGSD